MFKKDLVDFIESGKLDVRLQMTTCEEDVKGERKRYIETLDKAVELFGDGDWHFVSAPGRTEIGGNHTDHQHGMVIAAAVNLDTLAAVKKNEDNVVRLRSAGFNIKDIDLSDLSIVEEQKNTTEALIRGIAARFVELGCKVAGFDGYSVSKVLVGSGISSSASFEVLVAQIFNQLFNEGKMDEIEIAKIAQWAENVHFGKPCGLLDQMAISCGGFTMMDFNDPANPIVEKCDFSFKDYGYELILTNTKGDHSDLSDEYAAIPNEMKAVAKAMGAQFLRDCSYNNFVENFSAIRRIVNNDRAMLRAYHLFAEDERVVKQKEAIKSGDVKGLLELMKESGRSSYMYLQNVSVQGRPASQSLAIALAASERMLKDGAFRVHGGGFEGTIQAVVKEAQVFEYLQAMQGIFGLDATFVMKIRPVGGILVI